MPEMDGIELARRAAELDPDIKIMFITGFAAVALNPDSARPSTPRCCPSRSTCATSSTRCRRCWRPDGDVGPDGVIARRPKAAAISGPGRKRRRSRRRAVRSSR